MTVVSLPELAVAVPVSDADVLERAADLLEEFGWCKNSAAVDARKQAVSYVDPEAVAFCAAGAYARASVDLGRNDEWHRFGQDLTVLLGMCHPKAVFLWNDSRGNAAQVVQRLRDAAKQARNQPGK